MNVLIWNCRGAVKRRLKGMPVSFMKKHKVELVILLETRVNGPRALKTISKLGFSNHIIEEARGFAGGIWALWNQTSFSIDLVDKSLQCIHLRISWQDKDPLILSAVYASPDIVKRRKLWEEIMLFNVQNKEPWFIAGDFNEILGSNENRGYAPVDLNRCADFADVLDSCNLMDLGGAGPTFTWKGPKFAHLDRVFKRLDRAVANDSWRIRFDEAGTRKSGRIARSGFYPWLEHPSFKQVLTENWRNNLESEGNLRLLVLILKEWNTLTYGHIIHKKNNILRRLEGIQQSLENYHNPKLERLEVDLRKGARVAA
ncbi:uncharacterized protein LOC133289697 [Gastrolobium bilobum]|uniref:uncharacterized protein LOC133289697 n=1 Tax=Gastrolobium bilobum TaxID=150636 RepID=UPI002AB24C4C|nr:uncharacterized protein LOC133289697 [Gastrolobium bilobum]